MRAFNHSQFNTLCPQVEVLVIVAFTQIQMHSRAAVEVSKLYFVQTPTIIFFIISKVITKTKKYFKQTVWEKIP